MLTLFKRQGLLCSKKPIYTYLTQHGIEKRRGESRKLKNHSTREKEEEAKKKWIYMDGSCRRCGVDMVVGKVSP